MQKVSGPEVALPALKPAAKVDPAGASTSTSADPFAPSRETTGNPFGTAWRNSPNAQETAGKDRTGFCGSRTAITDAAAPWAGSPVKAGRAPASFTRLRRLTV